MDLSLLIHSNLEKDLRNVGCISQVTHVNTIAFLRVLF